MEIHVSLKNEQYTTITEAINNATEGDVIIIHEGIYRETLNIAKSNLTIQAYQDDYVLVTGNEVVTNFAQDSTMSGVYVADIPQNYNLSYSQVFANGKYQTMARFPKLTIDDMMSPLVEGSGYGKLVDIYKEAGTTKGFVSFDKRTLPNVDLTGAIFRGLIGKNRHYAFGKVISSNENTISFNGLTNNDWGSTNEIKSDFHDYGFGFITHKNLISTPKEWFIQDNKLYYMPESNINDLQVEMQVREKVLIMENAINVTFEHINFISGNVEIINSENLNIKHCSFRYLQPFYIISGYGIGDSMKTGIYIENGNHITFRNTYVGHTWGHGIHLSHGENNSFHNCIIEDIGWIGTFTSGIYTSANNTHIEDCSFRDNGRFQIRVDQDIKINILHSSFERAMKMGEDAGPLEFTSTGQIGPVDLKGSEIAYNKIFDLHGIPVSAGHYNKQFVVAFYMEDVNNYTAHHNLVYDITSYNYNGPEPLNRRGTLLYLGPRCKAMHEQVNFYNNTAWDYTNNINIWNIQIANFDEIKPLGLKYEAPTGTITNGHFVNNLLNIGEFGINYSAQNYAVDGKKIGWAKAPENAWKSIQTSDMDEYFEHAAKVGYFFNPKTNLMFDKENGALNYLDAENGDFRLINTSIAKKSGTPIEGITSSDTPDLGALEGSDWVLSAGATLNIPQFTEIK
ncbi:hypothetical protein AN641_07380 [Candidatus Epulonipiscioides gigas]|nr:hypothetical protein AN641_07380 [Epulopiscium sp. SCG-C07WGA-EpuloA2]